MIRFLKTQNIFYTHQYGFRKNRDTQQPLIQLLNKVYEGLVAVLELDCHPDHNKGPEYAPCACP